MNMLVNMATPHVPLMVTMLWILWFIAVECVLVFLYQLGCIQRLVFLKYSLFPNCDIGYS